LPSLKEFCASEASTKRLVVLILTTKMKLDSFTPFRLTLFTELLLLAISVFDMEYQMGQKSKSGRYLIFDFWF
jgi:hypothetical protein